MEAAGLGAPAPRRSVGRRLADLFHGRPRLQVGALLAGPVGWLVIGYLGSLLILLIASFWSLGELSGELEHTFTFDNFNTLLTDTVYRTITLRTILIAALVTVTDALLALPLAFFMAKVARPRSKGMLLVAVLVPLWSSYLVKVYAWRTILSEDGVLNWLLDPLGLSGPGYGNVAVWLVMSYIWLPYMIIPVYAGLERIPNSVLAASDDLGAKPWHTFRRVIWPLVFPAIGRRLDLHVLAHPRRLHHPAAGQLDAVHRQRHLRQLHDQPAARGRLRDGADHDHDRLPADRPALRRLRARMRGMAA